MVELFVLSLVAVYSEVHNSNKCPLLNENWNATEWSFRQGRTIETKTSPTIAIVVHLDPFVSSFTLYFCESKLRYFPRVVWVFKRDFPLMKIFRKETYNRENKSFFRLIFPRNALYSFLCCIVQIYEYVWHTIGQTISLLCWFTRTILGR